MLTSFMEFDYDRISKISTIIADKNFKFYKSNGSTIEIMKLSSNPRYFEQTEIFSYITELNGQCGVALLYCIPFDLKRLGELLPVAEELCKIFNYNTLLVSVNREEWVENLESFDFKKVYSNTNIHTDRRITLLCKSMGLDDYYPDEDDYYDEEEEN